MIRTLLLGALALTAPVAASAVTFSFTGGASSAEPGYTVIDTFDNGAGLTGSNFQIKSPPSDSNGAVPAFARFGGASYLSVLSGGSATYAFTTAAPRRVQFDWGSMDAYNTLTVTTLSGAVTRIVPGTSFANAANGDQSSAATNGLFSIDGGTDAIRSLTFESSGNSFEVDNLAVAGLTSLAGAVPEPASWMMLLAGCGAAGVSLRRRTKRQQGIVTA